MRSETKQSNNNLAAIALAVFAAALIVAFLDLRGSDIGQLPQLIGNLGGGSLIGNSIVFSLYGFAVSILILYSWFSAGVVISQFLGLTSEFERSPTLVLACSIAIGAAAWSVIWCILGFFGFYLPSVAIICVVAAIFNGSYIWLVVPMKLPKFSFQLSAGVVAIPVILALASALAPPIAKDTLLYHFSVPKAFVSQHGNAFVQGNIASYLSLGAEMQVVWARLLGGLYNERAAEVAGGAVMWLFFPLLLTVVYGWAREIGISRATSLIATLTVAAVPTAYHVASSGYIDLSLALYVTLATYSLTRWWKEQTWGWAILIAIFLGAALSVKLTAVFVIAAFALIVLLRARAAKNPVATANGSDDRVALSPGRIVLTGFAALLLAGAIASPWYIRTWVATDSPVFPFYMSIWPGKAAGWDVERSNLFQAMNSQYGGADVNKINYLIAPVRVSVAAQPEKASNYDGVLGPAFLIGLPLLIFALWKLELGVEVKIIAGVAGVMYLFWLFSSAQLRYLLPIVPMLGIAIAAAVEKIGGRLKGIAQFSLVAASVCGLLTTFAWFCQKAPLRVVLGGETRDEYLARNLDYYPFYQEINANAPADAKVWLINMRRDTYTIERPVVSDYLFEDWTLRKMLWESRSVGDLRTMAKSLGASHVLARHDFLFEYDRSTLVDDKRPRAENEAKLKIARDFILDKANTIRADEKFSLIKVN